MSNTLKKNLAIVMAITMLMCMCACSSKTEKQEPGDPAYQKLEQIDTSDATNEEKMDQNKEQESSEGSVDENGYPNTPDSIAKWVKDMYQWEEGDPYRFIMAWIPEDADYPQIDENIPVALYAYPYNTDCTSNNDSFVAPKDMQQEIVDAAIDEVKRISKYETQFDYKNVEQWEANANSVMAPNEYGKAEIEATKKTFMETNTVLEGKCFTSPELVYRDISGNFRVRCVNFFRLVSGGAKGSLCEKDKWYRQCMEYVLVPTEIVCSQYNLPKWKEYPLTLGLRVMIDDLPWTVGGIYEDLLNKAQ